MARPTAAEKRERWAREDAAYTKRFLRDLAKLNARGDLYRLANDGRTSTGDPGDKCHHWLGCALNSLPYDSAPREVREAIDAALLRASKPTRAALSKTDEDDARTLAVLVKRLEPMIQKLAATEEGIILSQLVIAQEQSDGGGFILRWGPRDGARALSEKLLGEDSASLLADIEATSADSIPVVIWARDGAIYFESFDWTTAPGGQA